MGDVRACLWCDAEFTGPASKRYCSKLCRKRAENGRTFAKNKPCECVQCGVSFTATRATARYCSTYCEGQAKRWRYLTNDRSLLTWTECECGAWRSRSTAPCPQRHTHPISVTIRRNPRCDHCGAGFETTLPMARFCSERCATREGKRRRKARTRNRRRYDTDHQSGRVRRHAIYERDAWRCQLCDQPVDPTLTFPHPQSATLDHRVPVSIGGADDEENLQLAHLACNSAKGSAMQKPA